MKTTLPSETQTLPHPLAEVFLSITTEGSRKALKTHSGYDKMLAGAGAWE